ncbi:MAG: hypothetical protein ABR955_15440, partial [Verrucomicrobiota bacterium]
ILQRTADAVEKARAGLASRAKINVGYIPHLTMEILPRALRAFRGHLASCVSSMAGPRLKLLKLRPALPPCSIVALWRKDAEEEPVKAFIAAALAKPAKR